MVEEMSSEGLHHGRLIPLDAVAAWSELLSYDDPSDALDAILHVQDVGEPEPDPITGENVWTEPYQALEERQQKAAAAQQKAFFEDTRGDSEVTQSRASLVAATVEDAVAEASRKARERLGVPEPGSSLRSSRSLGVDASSGDFLAGIILPPVSEELAEFRSRLRTDLSDTIVAKRREFIASISPLGGSDGS